MSHSEDDELTESGWEKPKKRVRISDEVTVYGQENDNELSDISTSPPMMPHLDISIDNTGMDLPDSGANGAHLDTSIDETGMDLPPDSSPEPEKCDLLNDIINATVLMSISDEEEESDFTLPDLIPEMQSFHLTSPLTDAQENIFQTTVQFADKTSKSSMSCKRSLGGTEKQTSKLSSCLSNNTTSIKSADELKNAVFKAWNEVKCEKNPFQSTSSCTADVQESIVCKDVQESKNTSNGASSNNAHEKCVKPQRKIERAHHKLPKPDGQKSKEDLEESKMAFEAWKKKKDELLKQQFAETCRKKKQEQLDLLLNEKIRKSDAESAYSAWKYHKIVVHKREEKEKEWFLDRSKTKITEKMKKNEEATKVYYEWLKNKIYFKNNIVKKIVEDRPCWTPPGKINSIM